MLKAVLIVVIALAAQSQPSPRPQQAETADDEQKQADQLRAIAAELRAINQRQADQEQKRANNKSSKWSDAFGPETWPNWTLSFFALLAAGVAIKTLRAIERQVKANIEAASAATSNAAEAKRSADIADRTLVATQRPFLLSEEFVVQHWLSGPPWHQAKLWDSNDTLKRVGFSVSIRWKNQGPTPALDVAGVFGCKKIKLGQSLDFDLTPIDEHRPTSVVAPNGTVLTATAHLDFDEINEIALDNLIVLIYGRMRYRDTFKDTLVHHTDVCVRVNVVNNPRTSDTPFSFPTHYKHNYAD